MMYAIFTGIRVAMASVRIRLDEDQVKTSICPGISMTKVLLCYGYFKVIALMVSTMVSGCERKRLRAVRMAPLGPS